ncbi:MAG: sulfatase [Candidatus Aminicenantes bacterium]|nr:MAG: sulfatase [Candidatus Aminicenantes bacterium]
MHQIKRLTLVLLIISLLGLLLFISCSKQKRIQVILISVDTLRGDHITSYGYFRDTAPNLARLVEDSVYYKNAYTNGCWTMPSHMSLLTGTLPSRHGVNKDFLSFSRKKYPKLHDSIKTISEILKSGNVDIKTVKFAKLSNELGFARGFDINNSVDPFFDDKKFNTLLDTLGNHKEENFFFFIHTWMAHAPYSHSYFLEEGKIDNEKRNYIDNFRRLSKKKRREILGKNARGSGRDFVDLLRKTRLFNAKDCVTLYDSGIHYVDRYIGKLISKCKQLGIYNDLMVIVVSDHGEHFEEHVKHMFYDYHGHDYYEEFIKVPIIIKYPRRFRHKIPDHPVSLIDVVPTVLDYYQIKMPSFIQGESLLNSDPKRNNKYIVSEAITGPGIEKKMIRLGHLKYIVTMKRPDKPGRVNWDNVIDRRLFDLETDPLEKKNLFKQSKFKNTCIHLEKILKKILEKSSGRYELTKEADIDKETLEHMKALGYL